MKLMKSFIFSYLRVCVFYILLMYLVTAPPTGPFAFKWNTLNVMLTLSYLFFYPVLIYRFSYLKKARFILNSPSTRELKQVIQENDKASFTHRNSIGSITFHNRLLLENESRYALMTGEFSFFLQGILLIVSGPSLIILVLCSIIKR